MNRKDWLASHDPESMLDFISRQISDRKLRLFTVACLRQLDRSLTLSEETREAMLFIEAVAEGIFDSNTHSIIHDTLMSFAFDPESSATGRKSYILYVRHL